MGRLEGMLPFRRKIGKALRMVTRSVRKMQGRRGLAIEAYRGYGSPQGAFLMGRVLHRREGSAGEEGSGLFAVGRRLLRRGCGGAVVAARFCDAEKKVVTDEDGYFSVFIRPLRSPPRDRFWHRVELELLVPRRKGVRAEADIFVPLGSRFAVVSDIDDTVIFTGVANKMMMLWRLFVQGPRSRVAFPGVAAFYRALHFGSGENEMNPMLYVSRGPWSLYEVLDQFFNRHDIPVGPILFLRKWNVSLRRPLPRRVEGHKLDLIREMFSVYRDLPFILIGDSGQHDPEIYSRVVREFPGRVMAIYIRNVDAAPRRRRAIETLAREVVATGCTLLLASDSFAMAAHAAGKGFISPQGLAAVLAERFEAGETTPVSRQETAVVANRTAVDSGQLAQALEEGGGDGSVIIHPGEEVVKDPLETGPLR